MAGIPRWPFLPMAAALAWCGTAVAAPQDAASKEAAKQQALADSDSSMPASVFAKNPAPKARQQPPQDEHGDTPRIDSRELADAVAEGLPRYRPPEPATSKPDDAKDLRELEKPKNHILRLPSYYVHERPPPVFNERQLLSKQGMADYNIAASVGVDPGKMPGAAAAATRFLFEDYANEQFTDGVRKQNVASANGTAAGLRQTGDTQEAAFLKKAADDAFMRRIEDNTTPLDQHAGWGAPVPSNSNSQGLPGQQ